VGRPTSSKCWAPTAYCRSRPTRWPAPPSCRRHRLEGGRACHDWRTALDGAARPAPAYSAPLSIYELHPGRGAASWTKAKWRFYNWRELAERLVPYVQELGFTHIELLPIMEHPFGGWGYQPLSLFAPTSRYGSRGLRRLHRCLPPAASA
jgi:1,4-alpha-glucan branching enzyme